MPIQEVIKYEGDNNTFVWKHPAEDFNTHSKLIVHESQEAIFFLNGLALDIFKPGKYLLETDNIPILRHLINIPTGGVSAFHCEVYFFNMVDQMAIPWGTDSKVQYIDPFYGFPISIGAGGEMTLRIKDSKKLLIELVGTESYLSRDRLVSYFRGILMAKIKPYIAKIFRENRISIFETDEYLAKFSDELKSYLSPDFLEYGIELVKFILTRFVKPEGDTQYEKFKEIHFRQYADIADAKIRQQVDIIDKQTEAQKRVIESESLAQKRKIEGYTYQQERGFHVAENLAQNEGVGNFTAAGLGLGVMAGIGGSVGKSMSEVINNSFDNNLSSTAEENRYCEECGTQLLPNASFCDSCGHPVRIGKSCPKCGYNFERASKFCPRCGTKRNN